MSKVVRFHKTGGPEVLQIDNIEVDKPGSGELRMKVKAIGLNRAEAMYRKGQYLVQPKVPSKLGYEAAGIVDAVGPDVKEFAVGDVVSVMPPSSMEKYGVYGDLALVPTISVVKHPSNLSFIEAAASWMQYLTAYGALFEIAKIKKGDYVVIPAASSSVGLAAIQLTNLVGAIPIAATRTAKKKKALLEAGAKEVIVTDEENLADRINQITGNDGARIAFDPVGGKAVLALAKGMSREGIVIEYGGLSPDPTPFPLFESLQKGLTMRGYTLFEVLSHDKRREEAKKFVLDGLSKGLLKPIIAKTFALDEIVEAHRYLESNQQFGKIIVTV